MALSLLCDEHIPSPVIKGLRRRGLDVTVVQQVGLGSTKDEQILEMARQQHRIVYTRDADFLRHHAAGVRHGGYSTIIPLPIPLEKRFEEPLWLVKYTLWMK